MSLKGEIIDYRGTLIHVPRNLESESVPLAASLLFSDDEGGAIMCHSHEISQ